MNDLKLTFVGAGNIASAIIGGLIENGVSPQNITAADPLPGQLFPFEEMGVRTHTDNRQACEEADVVVLSVKPNVLEQAARGVATVLARDILVISVAAGIRLSSLAGWLGENVAIVRCMPNTPALVGAGATGLFANTLATEEQRETADHILSSVSRCIWLSSEADLDAVTALSGSGPAYFFYFMEVMINTGVKLGLEPEVARKLVVQTALGAALMVQDDNASPARLREQVTSPGGTTEAALHHFARGNLSNVLEDSIQAAFDRSVELSRKV